MKRLSFKQQNFLNYIKHFISKFGQSPSYKEIMVGLNFCSLGTVNWYVNFLEKEGYLYRTKGPNGKRALSLSQKEETKIISQLPMLGFIAAGEPIEAIENIDMLDVPSSLLHPDNYILKVRGDSMIDEHIRDGDFIVVKKTEIARSGQIIVALIDGEATLKYFIPKKNYIELHPKNIDFPVIKVFPNDDFRINGVLLYSFRNYLS